MKKPQGSNQPHQTSMAQAMTDRIDELINEATETMQGWDERLGNYKLPSFDKRKFADLMVQECIDVLRKEWYNVNDIETQDGESPRDIALRVGRKGGLTTAMNSISKHFGKQ